MAKRPRQTRDPRDETILDDGAIRNPDGTFKPGVKPPVGRPFQPGNSASSVKVQFDFGRVFRSVASRERAESYVERVFCLAEGKEVEGTVDDGERLEAGRWIRKHLERFILVSDEDKEAITKLMQRSLEDRLKVGVAQLHAVAAATGNSDAISEALKGEKTAQEALRVARDAPEEDDGRDIRITIRNSEDSTVTTTLTPPKKPDGSDG